MLRMVAEFRSAKLAVVLHTPYCKIAPLSALLTNFAYLAR